MKQKKKYIIISIAILIILFIIGSFYYIYFNDRENMDNTIIDDTTLIEEVFSDKNISHNKEIIEGYRNTYNNQDVVGEIEFLNTDYKKPLMQYSDNDYYLNHTEDKTSSYMGSIYLDFRTDINNSDKLLIYGHNSASIDMPFKILESYYDYLQKTLITLCIKYGHDWYLKYVGGGYLPSDIGVSANYICRLCNAKMQEVFSDANDINDLPSLEKRWELCNFNVELPKFDMETPDWNATPTKRTLKK